MGLDPDGACPPPRWRYRDPLLVWLMPVSYAIHIAEEWIGGFPEWIAAVIGSPLPRGAFILINGIALAVMILGTQATTRSEKNGWMGIAIATALFINGLLHVFGSLMTGTYSPGLFTSIVLYLPISQLVLLRAWFQVHRSTFVRGFVTGIVLHALVSAIAVGLTR